MNKVPTSINFGIDTHMNLTSFISGSLTCVLKAHLNILFLTKNTTKDGNMEKGIANTFVRILQYET